MPTRDRIVEEYLNTMTDVITRKITLDLWTLLVKYTPVDIGRARAGWSISEGQASHFVPTPEEGGRFARPKKPQITTGLKVRHIVNNVEYILVLDQGRSVRDGQMRGSAQAPRGMTTLALSDLRRWARRASRLQDFGIRIPRRFRGKGYARTIDRGRRF